MTTRKQAPNSRQFMIDVRINYPTWRRGLFDATIKLFGPGEWGYVESCGNVHRMQERGVRIVEVTY